MFNPFNLFSSNNSRRKNNVTPIPQDLATRLILNKTYKLEDFNDDGEFNTEMDEIYKLDKKPNNRT